MSDVAVAAPRVESAQRPKADPSFLAYFEGIRGFFALYIGVAHLWVRTDWVWPGRYPLPPHFWVFSHNAIGMFLVISGYVLGLPVAKQGQTFRGGLRVYAKRRMKRILPGYYAALILAIPICLYTTPIYHRPLSAHLFVESLILHVFLLHNFLSSTLGTIDGPMWSIAVEADIYILFPLLLVPLVRRFGFVPMIATGFALGLIPTVIGALRHQGPLYVLADSCFWYIGLFGIGYAAANLTIDKRPEMIRFFARMPWATLAKIFFVGDLLVVANTPLDADRNGNYWCIDILLGIAVASQFLAIERARRDGRTLWFERFFMLKPLLFLGTFSYSFYLVHLPIIDLTMSFVKPTWSESWVLSFAAIALILSLGISYLFYRVFERPFMSDYRRRGDEQTLMAQAVPTSAVTPIAPHVAGSSG